MFGTEMLLNIKFNNGFTRICAAVHNAKFGYYETV